MVSMAAARGWGGEARIGGGGRVGRKGQKGRPGEGQAAGRRVRKMGWMEQEGGWSGLLGPREQLNTVGKARMDGAVTPTFHLPGV